MIWRFIIIIIISSFIATPVILFIGNKIAKINNLNFSNSFLVCLIATLNIFIFWYISGEFIAERLIGNSIEIRYTYYFSGLLIHTGVSFIFYTLTGKLIWKSTWIKTIKAHIIWLLLNVTILLIFIIIFDKQLMGLIWA